jgi:hypothetical protein
LVVAFGSLSLWSLPAYYRTPKQPNRQSVQWLVDNRQPGDRIVGVYLGEWGLRFYGAQFGIEEGRDFVPIRSLEELNRLEAQHKGGRVLLVTTFPRALRLAYPELNAHILDYYQPRVTFPASVGDGEITIWSRRDIP